MCIRDSLKLDPYINVDPGTMNPYQHGEVYVTEDGAETDLDLGHYEPVSYTHLRAHETVLDLVCRLLLEKKNRKKKKKEE